MFSPVQTAVSFTVPNAVGSSSAVSTGASVGLFSAPPAHTGSALSFVQAAQSSSSLQTLHPATPMTPATPAVEGSGIVPQLQ